VDISESHGPAIMNFNKFIIAQLRKVGRNSGRYRQKYYVFLTSISVEKGRVAMKSNLPESPKGQTLRRRINTIVTLLFLTLLVGSLVVVVNMIRHGSSHAANSASSGHSASSRSGHLAGSSSLSVFVAGGLGELNKLDAQTGKLIWRFQSQGKEIPAPPTVANGIVYFGSTDGNVYAVNADNGTQLWEFTTDGTILGSPTVDNGVVYAGSDNGSLYALDAQTGNKLWSYHAAPGNEIVSVETVTVANGSIYGTSSNNTSHSFAFAVDAKTGAQTWIQQVNNELLSAPQFSDGKLYVVTAALTQAGKSTSIESHLDVFDAASGSLPQQTSQDTESINANIPRLGTPTVANGVVFYSALNGNVSAVSAGTAAVQWKHSFGGQIDAAPQVANGFVYVGVSNGSIQNNPILALNAGDGSPHWQHSITNYAGGNLVVNNGMLYVGASDCTLYALNANTGSVNWTYSDGAPFCNTPITVA
jgi:outer membrane protein assembly factor BamB